ncbi:uncharacterized protein LOC131926983 isoform X2 [Physella acuta]|uniref:uncharacterized protein LOC131926983 isoform X2 n=1 Tax=Physella acuta TaxID=109671 RepID=UPI0027DC78B9|nr:uncharacterized protein LOC131926983 isoform X2 [Physella acuta]
MLKMNAYFLIRLCIIFRLSSLQVLGISKLYGSRRKADIQPKDAVVFYGEILRLKCTLSKGNNGTSTSEMYFEFFASGTNWTIKENLNVSPTSIEVDVNITEAFATNTRVNCRGPTTTLTTFIHAYGPIQNVTDFKGIYYYKDKINVTWNLTQTYLNPDVKVYCAPSSAPTLNYSLPCNSETNESCIIEEDSYFGQPLLFFKITVSLTHINKRNTSSLVLELPTSATSIHKFIVDYNIKSGPTEDLAITHKTSTCLNFTWRNPVYFDHCTGCSKFYQVEFKSEDSWMRENSTTLAPYPQANSSIALCHLKPFTTYTLRFQVKGQIQQPWSDWTYITGSTNEDRPLYGPNLTETSFYEEKCTDLNERKVYIYWQEPTASLLQGVLTYYEVEINNATDLLRKGSNYYIADLNCETDYNISIYAATKVGKSLQPSSIFIPAHSKAVIKDLQFKVEEKFDIQLSSTVKNISATWDTSSADQFEVLEFYYCEEYYITNTCFDDLKTVAVNFSSGSLELLNMNIKINLFGYALKYQDKSVEGIHWTDCVYRADVEPKAPSGFQVNPGDVGSLTLTWRSEPCSKDTKTLILYYHISICSRPEFNAESCTRATVNSYTTNFTAYDLEDNQQYTVYIWAQSHLRTGPKLSSTATTRKNEKRAITKIFSTAMFVCIFGFSFVCILALTYIKCFQSKKHIMTLTEAEWIPSSNDQWLTDVYSEDQAIVSTQLENQAIVSTHLEEQAMVSTQLDEQANLSTHLEKHAIMSTQSEIEPIVYTLIQHQAIVSAQLENHAITSTHLENHEIVYTQLRNPAALSTQLDNQMTVSAEFENKKTTPVLINVEENITKPAEYVNKDIVDQTVADETVKQPKPSSHACDPGGDSNHLNYLNNSEGVNRQVKEYIRMAHHGDTNLATIDLQLFSPRMTTFSFDMSRHPLHEVDVFYIKEDIRHKNFRYVSRNVTNRENRDMAQIQTEQEEEINSGQSVPVYVSINSTSPDMDAFCNRNNRLHLISDQFSLTSKTDRPVLEYVSANFDMTETNVCCSKTNGLHKVSDKCDLHSLESDVSTSAQSDSYTTVSSVEEFDSLPEDDKGPDPQHRFTTEDTFNPNTSSHVIDNEGLDRLRSFKTEDTLNPNTSLHVIDNEGTDSLHDFKTEDVFNLNTSSHVIDNEGLDRLSDFKTGDTFNSNTSSYVIDNEEPDPLHNFKTEDVFNSNTCSHIMENFPPSSEVNSNLNWYYRLNLLRHVLEDC